MATPPAVATEVDLCGMVVRVLLSADRQGAEGRFMCVSSPLDYGTAAVDGFPWTEALADRTAEFLTNMGIQSRLEVIKARG